MLFRSQLSLAIGKSGINVRLSVKLTDWKLDILSEEEYSKTNLSQEDVKLSLAEKIALSKNSEEHKNDMDAGASLETSQEKLEEDHQNDNTTPEKNNERSTTAEESISDADTAETENTVEA